MNKVLFGYLYKLLIEIVFKTMLPMVKVSFCLSVFQTFLHKFSWLNNKLKTLIKPPKLTAPLPILCMKHRTQTFELVGCHRGCVATDARGSSSLLTVRLPGQHRTYFRDCNLRSFRLFNLLCLKERTIFKQYWIGIHRFLGSTNTRKVKQKYYYNFSKKLFILPCTFRE